MKANGIHQSQSGGATASSTRDTPIPTPRRKTSTPAGPKTKKRKLDNYTESTSNVNTDDDEGLGDVKAESSTTVKTESIKAEPIQEEPIQEGPIQEEPTGQEGTPDSTVSADAFQGPSSGAMGFDGAQDSTLFDEFLAFGGSSKKNYGPGLVSVAPATGDGDGQEVHESILITD